MMIPLNPLVNSILDGFTLVQLSIFNISSVLDYLLEVPYFADILSWNRANSFQVNKATIRETKISTAVKL